MPESVSDKLLKGPLGPAILRPWFDRVGLWGVSKWYFPLSRAWAAALESNGDVDHWLSLLGGSGRPRKVVETALRRTQAAAAAHREADATWEAVFFGAEGGDAAERAWAERRRLGRAHDFMGARSYFSPLQMLRAFPPVRLEIPDPAEVRAGQGERLANPEAAWPLPAMSRMTLSDAFDGAPFDTRFLRFDSPVLGDPVTARVLTPTGAEDPPTLIMLHGVAMETEFWKGLAQSTLQVAGQGVRLVLPEGPWHGRRRLPGWYGGEPVLGQGPLGLMELFEAWVAEVSLVIRWARASSRGPIAVGGVSLGALTTQILGSAPALWPAEAQPDALFLIATTGDLAAVAEHGSLVTALGLPPKLEAAGWTDPEVDRWLPLLEPAAKPLMAPENVVMSLGSADDLTPYRGGLDLARRWAVPEENVFKRERGHFSVSLGLLEDPRPLARLREILARLV